MIPQPPQIRSAVFLRGRWLGRGPGPPAEHPSAQHSLLPDHPRNSSQFPLIALQFCRPELAGYPSHPTPDRQRPPRVGSFQEKSGRTWNCWGRAILPRNAERAAPSQVENYPVVLICGVTREFEPASRGSHTGSRGWSRQQDGARPVGGTTAWRASAPAPRMSETTVSFS